LPGRADVIALLARTGDRGSRGLTLFVVDKPRFDGPRIRGDTGWWGHAHGQGRSHAGLSRHALVRARVSTAGSLPDAQVRRRKTRASDGASALQMAGFAAGRLQTGGRACAVVTCAAVEAEPALTSRRGSSFGRPIGDYGLTRVSHRSEWRRGSFAARAISTYAAARAMDGDGAARRGTARRGWRSCSRATWAVEVNPARPAAARRLGLCRGVSDQSLRRRRRRCCRSFRGASRPILALKVVGSRVARTMTDIGHDRCERCFVPATRLFIAPRSRASPIAPTSVIVAAPPRTSSLVELGAPRRDGAGGLHGRRSRRRALGPGPCCRLSDGAWLVYPLHGASRANAHRSCAGGPPPARVSSMRPWSQARRMYRKARWAPRVFRSCDSPSPQPAPRLREVTGSGVSCRRSRRIAAALEDVRWRMTSPDPLLRLFPHSRRSGRD